MHVLSQDIDFVSTCYTLVACLQEVRAWSDSNPGHLPIMILLEPQTRAIPDPFMLGCAVPPPTDFEALEAEVLTVLPRSRLIVPDMVTGMAQSLAEGVRVNGWPTIAASRGKVLMALQINDAERGRYTGGDVRLAGKVFFPRSTLGSADCAFLVFNDPVTDQAAIRDAVMAGMLVRTRADSDTWEARAGTTDKRTQALASGAQFVSTDYPNPLAAALVPADIKTGYSVSLPPRCNPLFAAQLRCQAAEPTQNPVTLPATPPAAFTDADTFTMPSAPPGLSLNNLEKNAMFSSLLSNWSELANYTVPNTVPNVVARDQAYVQPSYTPPSYVLAMHDMPRVGARTFTPNREYVVGLVWVLAPFLIVALLFALTSLIVFCKCGCRCRESAKSKETHHMKTRLSFFVLLILVAVAGCAVAIWGDLVLASGISNVDVAADNAFGNLTVAYDTASEFQNTTTRLDAAITKINEICPGVMQNNTQFSDLQQLGATVDELVVGTKGFADTAEAVNSTVQTINTYHTYLVVLVFVLVVVLMAAFFVSLVLSPAFMRTGEGFNRVRARTVRYCLVPSGVLVLTITIVIVGLLVAVSVASGDFCTDPDQVALTQLPTENSLFLANYLPCNATNHYLRVFYDQSMLLANATSWRPVTRLLADQCPAQVQVQAADQFAIMGESLTAAARLLNAVAPLVSCSMVKGTYSALVYDSVCSTMARGILILWVGVAALTVGFVTALWVYGRIAMTEYLPADRLTSNVDIASAPMAAPGKHAAV
eukprot:comp24093_c0_seq2/m.43443 comp24093_c0_seq2/g.43443  ORF comp24093_c0_seq2/g.43443 comp24093_c0_seq2/m.43443 type:complete len:765 (-) comp24093_c0_seq2:403-2697(-)